MFPSEKYIQSISNHILFIHGHNDQLIPVDHSKKLYKHHQNVMTKNGKKPIKPIYVENAGHNDVVIHLGYQNYNKILKNFIYSIF